MPESAGRKVSCKGIRAWRSTHAAASRIDIGTVVASALAYCRRDRDDANDRQADADLAQNLPSIRLRKGRWQCPTSMTRVNAQYRGSLTLSERLLSEEDFFLTTTAPKLVGFRENLHQKFLNFPNFAERLATRGEGFSFPSPHRGRGLRRLGERREPRRSWVRGTVSDLALCPRLSHRLASQHPTNCCATRAASGRPLSGSARRAGRGRSRAGARSPSGCAAGRRC